MGDLLCIIMGILDILAGIFLIIGLNANILGIILGAIMICKGGLSFI
jgi:uncharacterized membrane protein YphA (DoxX/SURF4 family)